MKNILIILFFFISCNETLKSKKINPNWEYCFTKLNLQIKDINICEFQKLNTPQELFEIFKDKEGFLFLKTSFSFLEVEKFKNLSMFFGNINPNDEIFLNQVSIGKTGLTIENDGHFFSYWNDIRNYRISKEILKPNENELVIKIRFQYEVSFWGNFFIGEFNELENKKVSTEFFRSTIYFPISCILIFAASFYLLIYFYRPIDKENLYYSIWAILSSISQLNFYITKVPFDLFLFNDYLFFQKFIFSSICLFPLATVYFSNQILRKKVYLLEKLIYFAFTLIPAILFFMSNDLKEFNSLRTPMFVISTFPILIYQLVLIFYRSFHKNQKAKIFLAGLIPFAFCILYDIYFHNIQRNDDLIYLSFLSMPTFIIAIGVIQSLIFVNNRNELEELNNDLDKKVLERTEELKRQKETTEAAYKKLDKIYKTDPLTNLNNRLELMNLLNKEMDLGKKKFCILMIDLDHFKQINDTYGHLAGDEALRISGNIISNSFSIDSISGRYGGEEFLVLIKNKNLEESCILANEFRTKLENYKLNYSGNQIRLSCSIGVSEFITSDSKLDIVIERADKALYIAKISGRNQVKTF